MNAALTKLGYSVYDVPENMCLLQEEYSKIFREGWTTDDFKRMYEDVDAVVDIPACYFWEEIHKAFPDAKIILTRRKDEDAWLRSFEKQISENARGGIFLYLSPTLMKGIREILHPESSVILGITPQAMWKKWKVNGSILKLKYRAHNAYVMQNAPPDKLLIFDVTQGWEPLCKFLNKPIPDEPFPRKNVGATLMKDLWDTHPIMKRIKREMIISATCLGAGIGISIYLLYRKGPMGIYNSAHCLASSVTNAIMK